MKKMVLAGVLVVVMTGCETMTREERAALDYYNAMSMSQLDLCYTAHLTKSPKPQIFLAIKEREVNCRAQDMLELLAERHASVLTKQAAKQAEREASLDAWLTIFANTAGAMANTRNEMLNEQLKQTMQMPVQQNIQIQTPRPAYSAPAFQTAPPRQSVRCTVIGNTINCY